MGRSKRDDRFGNNPVDDQEKEPERADMEFILSWSKGCDKNGILRKDIEALRILIRRIFKFRGASRT
jgi:hypothetical protein